MLLSYPDIDHPKSIIGTLLRPISVKIFEKTGHRSLTHSLIFAAIFSFNKHMFLAVLSHMLLDMMTPMGVKLFYPSRKNYVILDGMVSKPALELLIIFLFWRW